MPKHTTYQVVCILWNNAWKVTLTGGSIRINSTVMIDYGFAKCDSVSRGIV